ncbi:MAG: hypothetical protein Q8Q89_03185 [bacterium]|nr:hypothetical protein [bacterium]
MSMKKGEFKSEVSDMTKEQTEVDLGVVSSVSEVEEKLRTADSGSMVTMNIEVGSQQERSEFVADFDREFKRRKLKVKIKTYADLSAARGWYIMTITKE